jgi:hypothetical protein
MTEIKLSPAMVAALKGAEVISGQVYVAEGTKAQTIKGLESRGLTLPESRVLSVDGVEAARQLGNDTTNLTDAVQIDQQASEIDALNAILRDDTPKGEGITPEMIEQAASNLLKDPQALAKAVDLDKPQFVPNREDKRKVRFSLKGAIARRNERKRARKAAKYGQTNFGAVAA